MYKGQLLSTEFLFAVSILIVLFALGASLWNLTSTRISENLLKDDLTINAIEVSDYLLKSHGSPTDWEDNTSTIYSLGLAKTENVLDEDKVLTFINLSYSQAKNLLGIPKYEFYFKMVFLNGNVTGTLGIVKEPIAYMAQQDPQDVVIRDLLNKSDLVWDFYWGDENKVPPPVTARFIYIGKNDAVFKMMIDNISSYNTIISEDSHVNDNKLNSSQQQALRNFVNSSHTYFHIQHPEDFLQIFGLNPDGFSTDKGTVVSLDEALINVKIGDNFVFQQGAKTFDIATSPLPLKTIMKATDNANKCIFCKWTYGKGFVYFIPDASNSTGQSIDELDIVGKRIVFGKKPTANANLVVNSQRVGLFRGDTVYIQFMVWQ